MVLSSFLAACVALLFAAVHLRRIQKAATRGDDLGGVHAVPATPVPSPPTPGAARPPAPAEVVVPAERVEPAAPAALPGPADSPPPPARSAARSGMNNGFSRFSPAARPGQERPVRGDAASRVR
jgi:hypothetical protein